ncbi:hypothetical protein BCR33DRAFT_717417 [Rhizoclosmatium globosum]|uniref:Suppressor of white apricot N-terminal domain-containing protein n=1 Tax=Rhizoclosmatium globosum TaxID=329046 RepID=A0A1Y2C9Q7_9FUNG|nr:hypothetical protein BCR33DRAFT_717417 [Rhizoclosmatium globosum]|eukprot:ORY43771.1 hypothetical protein BCR33DRAFT_717417 [Rhizoclosmatium globosum]
MRQKADRDQAALRRARRKEAETRNDPRNLLRISGTALKPHFRQTSTASNLESGDLLVWQGDGITRIDRFDVRNSVDMLNQADVGQDISLDPEDETPQSLPETKPLNQSRDEFILQDSVQFERYRDLVENELASKHPEKVIEFIDKFWNELYLMKPNLKKSSNSTSSTSEDGTKSLEVLVSELSANETLLDIINDLKESHINTLNARASQYSISNAYSHFKSELKQDPSKETQAKKRTRKLSRPSKTNEDDESNGSTSDYSLDDGNSGFVLEFDSGEAAEPERVSEVIPSCLITPQFPKRNAGLSSFTRNIVQSEFEPASRSEYQLALQIPEDHFGINAIDETPDARTESLRETFSAPLRASDLLKLKARLALDKQSLKLFPFMFAIC